MIYDTRKVRSPLLVFPGDIVACVTKDPRFDHIGIVYYQKGDNSVTKPVELPMLGGITVFDVVPRSIGPRLWNASFEYSGDYVYKVDVVGRLNLSASVRRLILDYASIIKRKYDSSSETFGENHPWSARGIKLLDGDRTLNGKDIYGGAKPFSGSENLEKSPLLHGISCSGLVELCYEQAEKYSEIDCDILDDGDHCQNLPLWPDPSDNWNETTDPGNEYAKSAPYCFHRIFPGYQLRAFEMESPGYCPEDFQYAMYNHWNSG